MKRGEKRKRKWSGRAMVTHMCQTHSPEKLRERLPRSPGAEGAGGCELMCGLGTNLVPQEEQKALVTAPAFSAGA
uniref:Bm11677 n=1 Tax=Brugia malayi TaxID=6279 RepID=A0A1I9G9L6_BRUMA|nr:Bm11677 [Brugia malayi]